jgi:competence protein ComEA
MPAAGPFRPVTPCPAPPGAPSNFDLHCVLQYVKFRLLRGGVGMNAVFTREERAVVLFLTVSLLVGSAIVGARRVFPEEIPEFEGGGGAAAEASVAPELRWPVNVNTADVDELDRLPGIGPSRAREIVRLRERLGGFTSLDQLLEVRGIGPVTLGKLVDKATIGDAAAGSAAPGDSSGR